MEEIQLEAIWKEFDRKIEEARILNWQAWAVNLETFTHLQTLKASNILGSLARFKVRALVLGVGWVLFLGFLVYANHWENPFFGISLCMIMAFTLIAIVTYLRQVMLIRGIDYSRSVVETQQRLSSLKASTIRSVRIGFLQMPFYCTWYWSLRWMKETNFWLIALPITLCFVWLSIWLYRNISLRNVDKKWFKILFGNKEWTSIVRAMNEIEEIENFKKR